MCEVTIRVNTISFTADVELDSIEVSLPRNKIDVVEISYDYFVPFGSLSQSIHPLVCRFRVVFLYLNLQLEDDRVKTINHDIVAAHVNSNQQTESEENLHGFIKPANLIHQETDITQCSQRVS